MDFGVEAHVDFVLRLKNDVSRNILMRLHDKADVVRVAAVSRLWYQFVVTNGISKQLCLRKFPQLSIIARVTEAKENDVECSNSSWDTLKREHSVYASLLEVIEKPDSCPIGNCIRYAVSASSTDHYLARRGRYGSSMPPFWSSIGHSDPNAPKTLIYKLIDDLCVITEIQIQPLKGKPIWCSKSVRFRLGHPKSLRDKCDLLHWSREQPADHKFIWTYTSQEFPMRQENCLQNFKLPEPVLCVGGYLHIELLGRALKCDLDDLFYICIRHVTVVGRSLSPEFDVEVLDPSQEVVLKYNRDIFRIILQSFSNGGPQDSNMRLTLSEGHMADAAFQKFYLQNHQPDFEDENEDENDEDEDEDDEDEDEEEDEDEDDEDEDEEEDEDKDEDDEDD
ncbi:hypothetical protein HAX54_036082 [Datura stramonium]|uniref:F-box protein n=1 Tax=Datura stramonium TaxID=4076 RepID=A0ABS8VGE4_DATST|nr:hypothetical protein [Datura stramonium]